MVVWKVDVERLAFHIGSTRCVTILVIAKIKIANIVPISHPI